MFCHLCSVEEELKAAWWVEDLKPISWVDDLRAARPEELKAVSATVTRRNCPLILQLMTCQIERQDVGTNMQRLM